MKKKILITLFILNSIILLGYFLPALQAIYHLFIDSNSAAAIGIIGGADGPTAIFVSSKYNYFPYIIIILEIVLGIGLFISRFKK